MIKQIWCKPQAVYFEKNSGELQNYVALRNEFKKFLRLVENLVILLTLYVFHFFLHSAEFYYLIFIINQFILCSE